MCFGQQLPDIREGDTLRPGMPVADVLDLSELEVVAKIGELDRANLHEGQDVVMELDAIAGKQFHGKIKGMSGTASSNVWSGDPAKKFDVIFSVDMRQLLQALGAKPEQIQRVLETAARNATKAPPVAQRVSFAQFLSPGGPPAGMGQGDNQRMAAFGGGQDQSAGEGESGGGQEGRQRSRGMRAGGGAGGGAQMSDADRQKFRAAMQKTLGGKNMQDLSPEERQKVIEKVRQATGTQGRGGQSSRGGAPGGAPATATGAPMDFMGGGGGTALVGTEEERAKANLPLPPEEDAQLDVLLRPGLLADVEIIVEKIPNAIHIPNQALFEKEGQIIAYVKVKGRFEARPVSLLKRSESTVVIRSGLKAGEIIALADPTATKKDQKGEKKSSGGGPMPGMGGGSGRKGGN
ncbi:MAG: efflux RND transporter periplasmic adaptor subunit, partial [Acidobacteria bacterium]|nr:efflux RND transporter periplasmic adaptor subunit [Acidobacteriota bacterium]